MSSMVKRFLVVPLVALVIVGLVIAAVRAGGSPPANEGELSGKITEAGSTSVLPLAEACALEFMKQHPKVTITYTGGGSSAGVKQATEGTVDIGAASREVKITEADLISYPIARDGVAIIVNTANPVNGLSMDQVRDIFEGKITDWSEVGGDPGRITVYTREEGSGTRDCFEHKVTKEVTNTAITKKSNGEMQLGIQEDASGIAYVSFGYLEGVKALAIDGVPPSAETAMSGEYPIVRRLYFLTRDAPDELVKAFIDFCRGSEGQSIAEDLGYVPLVK